MHPRCSGGFLKFTEFIFNHLNHSGRRCWCLNQMNLAGPGATPTTSIQSTISALPVLFPGRTYVINEPHLKLADQSKRI